MNPCFLLRRDEQEIEQAEVHTSFTGGRPALPASESVPACKLCGTEQVFFLQVAFPAGPWAGRSLAVFACVACASEEHLIPEMLTDRLRGIDIPGGFLEAYQRNFRFLVFPTDTAQVRKEYQPKVKFFSFLLVSAEDPTTPGNKIGGEPNWLLENEAPGSYAGSYSPVFLLQLEQGLEFETVEGAPRQIELGLDGKPKPTRRSTYELFLANALYLFGFEADHPFVYAITQVD